MPITCPNRRLKAYKDLVKIHGENISYSLWNEYEGNVPERFYKEQTISDFSVEDSDIDKVQEDFTTNVEPFEVNEDNYVAERERLFLIDRMTREYQGIQTYFNNIKLHYYPNINNIKNPNIKSAIDKDNHYVPEINSANKRYVTNKYFRVKDGKDFVQNKPYYPYTSGTIDRNLKLVKLINADFKEDVVTFDTKREVIIFTNKIDNAKSLTERFEDRLKDLDVSLDELTGDVSDLVDENTNKQLEAWEEVIFRKTALKKVLIRKLAEGAENAPEIRARISRIDDYIDKLNKEKLDIEVDIIASEDLREVNRRLYNIQANIEKDLNEDDLANVITELQEISTYIQGWMDITSLRNTLEMEGAIKENILNISAQFKEAHDLYYLLLKPAITKYASIVSYKKFTDDDLYKVVVDTDMITAGVLGGAMSNVELVKITQDILNKTASKINNEMLDKKKQLDDEINKLKTHLGITDLNKISEMFLQTDSKGVWTGNLVHRVNAEYWKKTKDLRESAQESGNWAEYYKFLETNTHELTEKEYDAWKKLKDSDKKIDYSKISTQRNSDGSVVFDEEDFLAQEKLMEAFHKHKLAYEEELINSGKYGNVTRNEKGKLEFETYTSEDTGRTFSFEKDFYTDLNNWEQLYHPFKKDPVHNSTKFKKFRIYDKVDSRWYDKKYDAIKKDPVLYAFYKFYKERMAENDNNLPNYTKPSKNALLNIRDTPMEYLAKGKSFKRVMGVLSDELIKSFTDEVESEYERGIVIAGKVYKSIPVGLLHSEVPLDQRSKNIFNILDKHNNLAISYKYKSAVEPITNAIMDVMEEVDAGVGSNIGGETILKKDFIKNTIFGKKGGLSVAKKQLENMVNAALYGDNKVTSYKGKKEYILKNDDTKRVASLDATVDSLIKFTYLKALAFPNIVSPFTNLGIGTVNNFVWAAGKEDFNEKALTAAYAKVFPALIGKKTPVNKKDALKAITWIVRLNVIPDLNASEYLNSQSWEEILTIFQNKTEYVNQGASTIAYLLHNKLKDKNGKDISIYDAYKVVDGNLVWDVDKMGEMSEVSSDQIISEDKRGVNIYRLERVVKGINHHIHGDYESTLLVKNNVLGRATALFKTWLFHTTYSRFGGVKYDPDLLRTTKGRYRSIFSATTKDGFEVKFRRIALTLLKGMVSRKAFDNLSDIDRVNLMKDLREFQMIIAISLIAMLLTGLKGDDDDELKKRQLNFLINLTTKTQSDLAFYMNPNSMGQILNNAVPIIATLGDFIKIAPAIYDTVTGDPVYEAGPWKDKSRLGVATMRAFPVLGGGVKMWNYATNQYDFGN